MLRDLAGDVMEILRNAGNVGKKWGGSLQILLPPDSQSIQNAQMVGSKKEIYWSCHEEQLPWPHLLGNVKSGELPAYRF